LGIAGQARNDNLAPLSDPERVGDEDGDTKISKPPKLHIQLITPNGEKKGYKIFI